MLGPFASLARLLLATAIASGLGCGSDGSGPHAFVERGRCAGKITGARYAVCAQLTTMPAPQSSEAHVVAATLNVNATPKSDRYEVRGGTFHAIH